MEPGSYTTNTILINAITSIPYIYLEPISSKPKSSLALLRRIEASWRGKGALVVCDSSDFGIWLFGNGNGDDPYAKVSTLCIVDGDGVVEAHGLKFNAESRGTFEPNAVKSLDVFHIQGSGKTSNAVTPISIDAIRNSQLINARAAQINNTTSIKQGQLPSPVNTGSSPEASDNTAKIRQLFISAVLGSASYLLCRDTGLIPLNARTLTSPYRRSVTCECPRFTAPMITINVALTASGALTLKATCQASSALSAVTISSENESVKANIHAGELIWLAPGGFMAKYLGPCTEELLSDGEISFGIGQNISHIQTRDWQKHCRMWLIEIGIDPSLLETCTWLMVQALSPTSSNQANLNSNETSDSGLEPLVFPWPAELSFVRHKMGGQNFDSDHSIEVHGNETMGRDPLTFAAKWFSAAAERDTDVFKRKQDRDAEIASKAQAETNAKLAASTTYSPVTARRNSVAGGVYPTPPDGVQAMTGVTPNFDGTSTPGNANQATPVNADSSIPMKEEHSNDLWNSSNARKERQGSEYPVNDEGDLFGDMENDIFGENNITDADFNFFDEPDRMLEDPTDTSAIPSEVQQLPEASPHQNHSEGESGFRPEANADKENLDMEMPEAEIYIDSPQDNTPTMPFSEAPLPDTSPGNESLQLSVTAIDHKPDIVAILSPELVFRRLFPVESSSKAKSSISSQHRRVSQFGAIGFESAISAVNDKYYTNGRFGYDEKSEVVQRPFSTTIPETEYLYNRHKRRKKAQPKGITTTWPPSFVKIPTFTTVDASEDVNQEIDPNSGTSELSDPDDTSSASDALPTSVATNLKRKRDIDDEGDDGMTSSFRELAVQPLSSIDIARSVAPPLDSDPADWPLDEFFHLPQPPANPSLALSDNEFIAAAQILTDQVASSTIQISGMCSNDFKTSSVELLDEKTIISKTQKDLAAVARRCFQDIETCNLHKFLSIQGLPCTNQTLRTKGHPQGQTGSLIQSHGDNPFAIKTPHVEVRRSDSRLTVLPSAVSFWENLGLGPCMGNKDISAVCIFPAGEAMDDNAAVFLERMRCAYESVKLGSHDKIESGDLSTEQSHDTGLVSMDLPSLGKDRVVNQQLFLSAIKVHCRRLGQALASLSVGERNLVVYFIYPSDYEEILPLVCSGFFDLYETYKRTLLEARAKVRNELVLQLIPKSFITSSTSIVVPSPADYTRLSLEVYDRCTDFKSPSCSPSILLEQPLPKSIEFKVTINPSVSLLDENSCIHVAYAQSIDDRWISAAWTDNRGSEQLTASYCLGRKSQPISRTFSEIADEIWETTLDIISYKAVNWRIMIAKSGVMDRSEIDYWTGLASIETSASVNLTLLSIKSRPSLQLLSQPVALSPTVLSTQSGMLTTPVSTPQSLSILSPEQTTTPAREQIANAPTPDPTPIEPPPSDATLIDITDQTWGSILSHRLNNSHSLIENNPSLLSGYLIKRSGTRPEDTPILFEINIVGVGVSGDGGHNRNARAYEHLLREVMGMYRGLGTLARVRGVVDSVKDARPWHIAAVEKAVKLLYSLM